MEYKVLDMISNEVKNNKKVALATITKVVGSSPRKEGAIMGIREDGTIFGSIGGGELELEATKRAEVCMAKGEDQTFHFRLNDEGSLHMQCGGEVDVFVKIFNPPQKLLIIGGGHIALKIYELSRILGFHIVIVEDREEFCNKERFPKADELLVGNIEKILSEYPVGDNCYIVIVTRGHEYDEIALRSVIESSAQYIGMIGSKNKTKYIRDNLIASQIPNDLIDRIYAPVGINLGGETPEEIALSVIAEIQLIKNKGSLHHLKDYKNT